MKKIANKIISIVLSIGLILAELPITTYANSIIIDSGDNIGFEMDEQILNNVTASAIETLKQIKSIVEPDGVNLDLYEDDLPSFVDLSDSLYLPEVELQVGGTCSSFSTTYYQYSYEVNRMRGITSEKDKVVYSPYYPFTYASAYIPDNYTQLQERGSIRFDEWVDEHADLWPASGSGIYCSSNVSAMREALKT